LEVGPKLSGKRIDEAERKLRVVLPEDYRAFLLRYNGGRPKPNLFPIRGLENNPFGGLHFFHGLDWEIESINLDWNFRILAGRIPSNFLSIATDTTGNQICLSLKGQDNGTMYYWDHDAEHAPPTYDNVYFIAASFRAFLDSIHDWEIDSPFYPLH